MPTAVERPFGSCWTFDGPSGQVKLNTGLESDFLFLDHKIETSATDLKLIGLDFIKLHTSPSLDAFHLKLDGIGSDFFKLSADMAANSDAFHKLGADFLKLGGNS